MMRLKKISQIAKALSHPARVQMLYTLVEEGELCGCEFAPALSLDPSIVSRYLAVLARAGLVTSRREGVRVMWRLTSPAILGLLDSIEAIATAKEKTA